jgi:hypothetical protein
VNGGWPEPASFSDGAKSNVKPWITKFLHLNGTDGAATSDDTDSIEWWMNLWSSWLAPQLVPIAVVVQESILVIDVSKRGAGGIDLIDVDRIPNQAHCDGIGVRDTEAVRARLAESFLDFLSILEEPD